MMVIFFWTIKISFYNNGTFIIEFVMSADVYFPDEKPNITLTTISTNVLSTCLFFLIDFNLYDQKYAYLKHHSKDINPKISAPFVSIISEPYTGTSSVTEVM
jgi:tellurite resistance protein TehA-like permease